MGNLSSKNLVPELDTSERQRGGCHTLCPEGLASRSSAAASLLLGVNQVGEALRRPISGAGREAAELSTAIEFLVLKFVCHAQLLSHLPSMKTTALQFVQLSAASTCTNTAAL